MSGSYWAPIVIPVVAMVVLAVMLATVYYADAHPLWRDQGGGAHPPGTGLAGPGQRRPEIPRQGAAAEAGQEAGGAPAPAAGAARILGG